MGSTDSGSIQSSSSGDNEEYDSRGDSISSFLNLQPPPAATATNPSYHHPSSSTMFDPFSPYLTPFPFPPPEPNSLSLDSTWPGGAQPSSLSSYSTCTTLGAMTATRSSASASASASASPSSVQPPVQGDRSAAAPRGSKKRSRASRRAPTTVLNTDTSNFRAMVQQFTGFPTPPFASSPFPRPRLDLFNVGAAVPPYLLRPSAQKIPASAPFAPMSTTSSSSSASSSLFDQAIASIARSSTLANINMPINATATSSSSSATPSSTGKCQLSLFDAQNALDRQSSNLISQSLLQSQTNTPQYNSHSLATFLAQPQGPSDYTMGGLGSLIATEGMKLSDRGGRVLSGWVDEPGQENAEHARSKAIIRNYDNQS